MGNDWCPEKLGEVVDFRSGWRNSQDAVPHGQYPFFTCSQEILRHNEFDFDTEAVIMAGNNADARFHLQYYKGKFAARQRTYIITPKSGDTSCRFIFYLLQKLQPHFAAQSQGTTTKFVTIGILRDAPILMPPLSEQEVITHILGTLDDKIELNRRMNETLEAMARAIFKSWFVDATEKGIPKGWKVAEISDITDVIDCLHSKKPERREQGFPLLQLWNIRDDGLIDMADTYYIGEADYKLWTTRMEALQGDCVITNVGRVGAVAQIPEGLRAALGRNMTGIRCKSSFPFPTFLIECFLSENMRNEIANKMDTGTILDALNVRNIPKLRVVLPSQELLGRFEELTRPLRARMEKNVVESRTLAAIRDALLPKLISGELRIPDAKRIIGEHV